MTTTLEYENATLRVYLIDEGHVGQYVEVRPQRYTQRVWIQAHFVDDEDHEAIRMHEALALDLAERWLNENGGEKIGAPEFKTVPAMLEKPKGDIFAIYNASQQRVTGLYAIDCYLGYWPSPEA